MQKKANADSIHVRLKMMELKAPHAAPLVAYADQVAAHYGLTPGNVPYPDPEHGGTDAEVLFVLSHPSPPALRSGSGSGLLSLENNDGPSATCFDQCQRTGLGFERITHWNAVPQPLAQGADPKPRDLVAGGSWLPGLLELLPKLRVVVLLGRNPETAWNRNRPHRVLDRFDPVIGPSPGWKGLAPAGARQRLDDAFDEVARRLHLA